MKCVLLGTIEEGKEVLRASDPCQGTKALPRGSAMSGMITTVRVDAWELQRKYSPSIGPGLR